MQNLLVKIRESLSELEKSFSGIANYILEHESDIPKMTIRQIAVGSGTSDSTVVRFCKLYGCQGFKDFRRILTADLLEQAGATEQTAYTTTDIRGNAGITEIVDSVTSKNIQSIRETKELLDETALQQAIEILDKTRRIDFYGSGASGLVALDAQQKFIRIGKTCNAAQDSGVELTLATSLRKGDVAIVISYSGRTREVIEKAKIAKEKKATVIAITKFSSDNPLADVVDLVLYTTSPEALFRSGATSSRIAQLTVIDVLFAGVVSRNLEEYQSDLENSYKYAALGKI